jgi:flagellar hook protein FlgE
MNQAFYSGLSGMQSHQTGIDVTADNLASINTIGFRGYTTEFSSIFDDVMGKNSVSSNLTDSIGYGSYVTAISMDEHQGSLMLTDSSTDVAIDGNGWFGIVTKNGNTLYTRSGAFATDADNNLVSRNEGFKVLGTIGTNMQNGVLTEELAEVPLTEVKEQVPLTFPKDLYYPAIATSEVSFYGNLGTEKGDQGMSSTIILVDGEKRTLKLLFTQSADQPAEGIDWDLTATIESIDGETIYSTEEGKVLFNSSGALLENSVTSIDNDGTPIAIDLGTGYDGIISVSQEATTSHSLNNGVERGELIGYDINLNGQVTASFTNGHSSAVASIALYHFQNDQGLDRYSGTHFGQSANSGDAIFYKDANGNSILGSTILNHKLENSNVKMEIGMTELIILQRAYSANAKSVTTGDELIQKALNMDA